jgi:hypothetical protein
LCEPVECQIQPRKVAKSEDYAEEPARDSKDEVKCSWVALDVRAMAKEDPTHFGFHSEGFRLVSGHIKWLEEF